MCFEGCHTHAEIVAAAEVEASSSRRHLPKPPPGYWWWIINGRWTVDCFDEEDCWYDPACATGSCPDYDLIDPSTFLPAQGAALLEMSLSLAGDDTDSSCIDNGAQEYSYYWEAPDNGCLQLFVMSDDMDLGLYVLDDCNGTELECSDDSSFVTSQFGRSYGSYIELDVVQSDSYIFIVEEEGAGTGTFDMQLDLNTTVGCDGAPLE